MIAETPKTFLMWYARFCKGNSSVFANFFTNLKFNSRGQWHIASLKSEISLNLLEKSKKANLLAPLQFRIPNSGFGVVLDKFLRPPLIESADFQKYFNEIVFRCAVNNSAHIQVNKWVFTGIKILGFTRGAFCLSETNCKLLNIQRWNSFSRCRKVIPRHGFSIFATRTLKSNCGICLSTVISSVSRYSLYFFFLHQCFLENCGCDSSRLSRHTSWFTNSYCFSLGRSPKQFHPPNSFLKCGLFRNQGLL